MSPEIHKKSSEDKFNIQIQEAKKKKKKKLQLKGSLLDDLKVDGTGKHFLPSSSTYKSPPKKPPMQASSKDTLHAKSNSNSTSKQQELKTFITTVPKKLIDLVSRDGSA